MAQAYQINQCDVPGPRDHLHSVPASRMRRLVLILAPQPSRALDIVALSDTFSEANRAVKGASEYEIRMVSSGPDRNLGSRNGVELQAAMGYKECFDIADTLLVAGSDDALMKDTALLNWLQMQASQSRRIGAVSSGALLLAEAGLLNGRRATTHWQDHETFSARHPHVSLERDVLYVRDANLYTCAGATAGFDLALSMIEADLGSQVATKVAESMLLCLRRPGSAPQISKALRSQAMPSNPITNLLTWLPGNLQGDLSVKTLARQSAMSPRNFARLFARQVGLTPAKHIENLRLEAARFQLESSQLTIDGVALVAGLNNSENMRRLFVRKLGVTPGKYRTMKVSLPQLGKLNVFRAHREHG